MSKAQEQKEKIEHLKLLLGDGFDEGNEDSFNIGNWARLVKLQESLISQLQQQNTSLRNKVKERIEEHRNNMMVINCRFNEKLVGKIEELEWLLSEMERSKNK